ncbi:hypothetical protein [Paenibacillus sp. Root52]|uniref:hypothetical protein n=1 Tax=Paenibacillus sp. Root52 TaxID=1736552 RepID=UPI0012E36335|nr:hypothetical protein [Paenibacillus sp. Root52]
MDILNESMLNFDLLTGAWDIGSFLENVTAKLGDWSKLFLMLIGLIAVVVAVFQVVTALWSGGKKQVNWFVYGALFILGGALSSTTGYDLIKNIAGGGRQTIEDLGGGVSLWFEYSKFYFFK